MKENNDQNSQHFLQDVNANRRRITIDEDGKPVKISESDGTSADNFMQSSLKLES